MAPGGVSKLDLGWLLMATPSAACSSRSAPCRGLLSFSLLTESHKEALRLLVALKQVM